MPPRYTGMNTFLYVTTPEKSAAFYKALGFKQIRHVPEMDVYVFSVGKDNLVLGKLQPFEPEHTQRWVGTKPWGHGAVLMPATPNVDVVFEAAKAAGANVLEPPADQPWGSRTLLVSDPDGYWLMFEQELKRPRAAAKKPRARAKAKKAGAKKANAKRARR